MKNLGQMMKQAQELQERLQQVQEELTQMEVTGSSAGGMCQITMTAKGDAKRLKLDPSLVTPDDVEVMEDLIVAAINDAKAKAEEKTREKMQEITGGLPLPPGMQLPF